jgi:hypothetical protein
MIIFIMEFLELPYIESCSASFLSTLPHVLRVSLKADPKIKKSDFHVYNASNFDFTIHDGHDYPYDLNSKRIVDRETYIETGVDQTIHIVNDNQGYVLNASFPKTSSKLSVVKGCYVNDPNLGVNSYGSSTQTYDGDKSRWQFSKSLTKSKSNVAKYLPN